MTYTPRQAYSGANAYSYMHPDAARTTEPNFTAFWVVVTLALLVLVAYVLAHRKKR